MSKCGFDTGHSYCKNQTPCAEHSHLVCTECDEMADHICGYGSNYAECSRVLCKDHRICSTHQKEWDKWMRRIEEKNHE